MICIMQDSISPERRRQCVVHLQQRLGISERRVCRTIGQPRSTQRKPHRVRDDEAPLTMAIIQLASAYGRYGYRHVAALLRAAGWRVNRKLVLRIWQREGLKVPAKQSKRVRLWLNEGSSIRLRPQYPNHVWAYDFVADRTYDGRALKMLTVIDEFSRQCLAFPVARRLNSDDVLATLTELFVDYGPPAFIRSDNGGEFTAGVVRGWLSASRLKPCISSPVVLGKMATTNRSMASCVMNCSTASSSTHWLRPNI
jgi:putative transposase